MKSILVIRHAKSSWDGFTTSDFERPLNERGKKDAPEMASRLLEKKIPVDLFVASPAKRAKKTAESFITVFERDKAGILFVPELYHAPSSTFYNIISGLEDHHHCVAIFSHNPGITEFVNTLTRVHVDNMPTCGIFAVQAPIEKWGEFAAAQKKFWFFDYPKSTQND